MRKDFGKLLLWVSGFTALFIFIALGTIQFIIADIADAARIIQTIAILVALCVGGVFAFQRLQIFRTFEPHLTISHEVAHRFVGDSYTHIDVTATLRNSSRVQVEILEGSFLIQRVSPESDEEIERLYAEVFIDQEQQEMQWAALDTLDLSWQRGELVVEPGETHPESYDFIVPREVKTVRIYTYFGNSRFSSGAQSAEGWVASTVYDIVSDN